MYVLVVLLTMLVLPSASVLVAHALGPADGLVALVGRWFVFWGVGVRLGLAALRQILQPGFTAKNIFHMTTDEAFPLVRELGVANLGTALVALLSIAAPSFVVPVAVSAALFFGFAGFAHLRERDRSFNENVAMVSDLFIGAVLLAFLVASSLEHTALG